MKIREIHLRDFKRFTDLTISGIPESARLVILLGPNGCGKSSLFDAFSFKGSIPKTGGIGFEQDYHCKVGSAEIGNWSQMLQKVEVHFHDANIPSWEAQDNPTARRAFYFRSSYHNEPDFRVNQMARVDEVLKDQRHPRLMINQDVRVSDNYQRIVSDAVEKLFDPDDDDVKRTELRDRIIGRVRESMNRVFGDLVLTGPGKPLEDGSFLFEKGVSKDYRYKNLSGGEKAAFDLLLDLIIKVPHFDNTVFCIDEPDLHMHSSLQTKLLDEMSRLIPEPCQLWVATHSIGMLTKAMELQRDDPDSVVFLDFDGHDFDSPTTIKPIVPSHRFWKDALQVALGDLASLVAPQQLILCESGPGTEGFDARCLNRIFESEFPDTVFVSAGGASEVEKKAVLVRTVLGGVLDGITIAALFDRDDRSVEEIENLQRAGVKVLTRRQLESYLWDDEVLTRLCHFNGRPDLVEAVLAAKQSCVERSINERGNPIDDFKSASGDLRKQTIKLLGLTGCGNTPRAFAVSTLAPLVTEETMIYRELRKDIFS